MQNSDHIHGASLESNVIIKKPLPSLGIVSSNASRVDRLLKEARRCSLLANIEEHTNSGWGVSIYTAAFKNEQVFVAAIPMGSAGAGFALFEMFAAGACVIIRYGSNDRKVTMDDLTRFIVVDRADNLVGLAQASGYAAEFDTILKASDDLVAVILTVIREEGLTASMSICHNVDDYHAYNFPQFFATSGQVRRQIGILEQEGRIAGPEEHGHCWDMETAALFWRANQFGAHAATVLQNLIKQPGSSPYEGKHGEISIKMEGRFYQIILESLCRFKNKELAHLPQSNFEVDVRGERVLAAVLRPSYLEPIAI